VELADWKGFADSGLFVKQSVRADSVETMPKAIWAVCHGKGSKTTVPWMASPAVP